MIRTTWQRIRARKVMLRPDTFRVTGIIRLRTIPVEWTAEDFVRYWCRQSERARDRYTVCEVRNILTTAGRAQILTYIGSGSGSNIGWGQYFAVGTFPLTVVSPGDTAVSGESFRVAPSSAVVTGTQVDILSQIGSAQAVGTLTNAGLYGNGASSTPGSGTLYTHALINNFVKANGSSYAADYLLNLN